MTSIIENFVRQHINTHVEIKWTLHVYEHPGCSGHYVRLIGRIVHCVADTTSIKFHLCDDVSLLETSPYDAECTLPVDWMPFQTHEHIVLKSDEEPVHGEVYSREDHEYRERLRMFDDSGRRLFSSSIAFLE
jgi:hypothetical protein